MLINCLSNFVMVVYHISCKNYPRAKNRKSTRILSCSCFALVVARKKCLLKVKIECTKLSVPSALVLCTVLTAHKY